MLPDDPDIGIFDAPPLANIHATCVAVTAANGDVHGVLLQGPSGAGKSDLALRLIDRGAMLVADDRCDLYWQMGRLIAAPPAALAGQIEVRGLGILSHAFSPSVPLSLAATLQSGYDRFPMDQMHILVAGHVLPRITIDAFEMSAPIKIALALDHLDMIGTQI